MSIPFACPHCSRPTQSSVERRRGLCFFCAFTRAARKLRGGLLPGELPDLRLARDAAEESEGWGDWQPVRVREKAA